MNTTMITAFVAIGSVLLTKLFDSLITRHTTRAQSEVAERQELQRETTAFRSEMREELNQLRVELTQLRASDVTKTIEIVQLKTDSIHLTARINELEQDAGRRERRIVELEELLAQREHRILELEAAVHQAHTLLDECTEHLEIAEIGDVAPGIIAG